MGVAYGATALIYKLLLLPALGAYSQYCQGAATQWEYKRNCGPAWERGESQEAEPGSWRYQQSPKEFPGRGTKRD